MNVSNEWLSTPLMMHGSRQLSVSCLLQDAKQLTQINLLIPGEMVDREKLVKCHLKCRISSLNKPGQTSLIQIDIKLKTCIMYNASKIKDIGPIADRKKNPSSQQIKSLVEIFI